MLKPYKDNQEEKIPKVTYLKSGVACTEKKCKGEMMIQKPYEEHYVKGRKGEPGAQKSELKRAICNKCGWKGWV